MLCAKKIYVWTAQQWTVKFTVNFVFLFPSPPIFRLCAFETSARSQWTLKRLLAERNWALAQLNNSRVLFTSATCFLFEHAFLSAHSRASRPKILSKGFPLKHSFERESWPIQFHFSSIQIPRHWRILENFSEKRFVNFSSAWRGEKRRKLLAGLMKTVNTHKYTHGSQ